MNEDAECVVDAHGDEAGAAHEVRPSVYSARPRGNATTMLPVSVVALLSMHQLLLVAALEESGRMPEIRFDAEDIAEQHAADADGRIRLACGVLEIDKRRRAAEGRAHKRLDLPFGGCGRGRASAAASEQSVRPRCVA